MKLVLRFYNCDKYNSSLYKVVSYFINNQTNLKFESQLNVLIHTIILQLHFKEFVKKKLYS